MKTQLARRLPVALAIAFLVTAGSVAAASVVSNGSAPAHAMIDIPQPWAGDRGTYQVTYRLDAGAAAQAGWDEWRKGHPKEEERFSFIREEAGRIPEWSGALVAADRVRVAGDGVRNATYFFAAGTGRILALASDHGWASGAGMLTTQTGAHADSVLDYCTAPLWAPSTIGNSWMGHAWPTSGSFVKASGPFSCLDHAWNQTLTASGPTEVGGIQAFRFEAKPDSGSIWLAPGLPYPIQQEFRFSLLNVTGVQVTRLIAFHRGDAPRPALATVPGPTWTTAAREPWGLPENGIRMEFPASEAYAVALQDNRAGLPGFLARHPDAYTGGVAGYELDTDGNLTRGWHFLVTDGSDSLALHVRRSTPQDPYLGDRSPLPHAPPSDWVTVEDSFPAWNGLERYSGKGPLHFPAPGTLATAVPTVASLKARWEQSVPGQAFTTWGFYVGRCEENCTDRTVYWGGAARTDQRQSLVDPLAGRTPFDYHESRSWGGLFLVDDGMAVSLQASTTEFGTATPGTSPPGASPAKDPVASGPMPTSIEGARALWPPAATVAGASGLGLVVAAAYLLWPVARHSFLGLFSRVQAHELAGHPTRRRILDAVAGQPGIHASELARLCDLRMGTLRHHATKLEVAGLLTSHRAAGKVHWFPGPPTADDVKVTPISHSASQVVLDLIRQVPGLSGAEVAQRAGLQPSTVSYHVQRLVKAGLVHAERDGHAVRLRPA